MITVNEIEQYFAETGKPDFVVEVAPGQIIRPKNAGLFIDSSILVALNHSDVKTYDVYFERLVKYYNKVKKARAILSQNKSLKNKSQGITPKS